MEMGLTMVLKAITGLMEYKDLACYSYTMDREGQ